MTRRLAVLPPPAEDDLLAPCLENALRYAEELTGRALGIVGGNGWGTDEELVQLVKVAGALRDAIVGAQLAAARVTEGK